MNNVMTNKSIDLTFCAVILALLVISIYWIWINKQYSLLGLPFIIIHFVFLGLAKTQFGALGKRLATKHLGLELLFIGAGLSILGIYLQ